MEAVRGALGAAVTGALGADNAALGVTDKDLGVETGDLVVVPLGAHTGDFAVVVAEEGALGAECEGASLGDATALGGVDRGARGAAGRLVAIAGNGSDVVCTGGAV